MKNKINYNKYRMSFKEVLWGFAKGFMIIAFIAFMFFRNIPVSGIAGMIGGIIFTSAEKKKLKARRDSDLLLQFRDLLESLQSSFMAGKNVMDAFVTSRTDLGHNYPPDSYIVREIQSICDGLDNNKTIEALLLDFAERSGLEDIKNFADVFVPAVRNGGNVAEVTKNTKLIINEKLEVENEIERVLNNGKIQVTILMVIPLLVLMMSSADSSLTVIPNTPANIIIKTIVLSLYAVAYVVSKKIAKINI